MLCEHSALYSATWPTSGSMRSGRSYPPLRPGRPTGASGSSSSPGLLPTPNAQLAHDSQTHRSGARTDELLLTGIALELGKGELLKTPTAQLAINGGSQHPDKRIAGGHGPTLADQVEHLLPTPVVTNRAGMSPSPATDRGTRGRDLGPVIGSLLPTPAAADGDRTSGAYPRGNPTLAGALLPTPSAADSLGGHLTRGGHRGGELLLGGVAKELALLPTPAAHDSGNTPENHLRKKPGRSQVTSLAIIAENGLLPTGGRMDPLSGDGSEP